MEERTDSPIAVKVEENSHSVVLTYFQGDINSMVDAHFSRALSKICKPTELSSKTKNIHKPIKNGKYGNPTRRRLKTNTTMWKLFVFFPLQSTWTPVRTACLTPRPWSHLKQDTLWASARQMRFLFPGLRSGLEKVRGCRPSCATWPPRGSVLPDSNILHPCSTCCTATGVTWDPAWPPAPNQNQYPAGQSLRALETLWTLLVLNQVSLKLQHITSCLETPSENLNEHFIHPF